MIIDTREMVNAALDVLTDPKNGRIPLYRVMAEHLIAAAEQMRSCASAEPVQADSADRPDLANGLFLIVSAD